MSEEWNYSIDAEQAVIGGLMLDNAALDQVVDLIGERDFYVGENRAIFRAVFLLVDNNKAADPLTVFDFLCLRSEAGEGCKISREYLSELVMNTPGAANIRRYAEIVRDRAVMRGLYGAAQNVAESVRNSGGRDVVELLDKAQASMMSIRDGNIRAETEFTKAPALMVGVI